MYAQLSNLSYRPLVKAQSNGHSGASGLDQPIACRCQPGLEV